MVVVMLVSWAGSVSYPGSLVGASGWPGWTWAIHTWRRSCAAALALTSWLMCW